MDNLAYIKESYDQLAIADKDSSLQPIRKEAFDTFKKLDIPTSRNEEWKYTRISSLFNKEFAFPVGPVPVFSAKEFKKLRLPGYENANELVFINGIF